jgi:hypothetical protein
VSKGERIASALSAAVLAALLFLVISFGIGRLGTMFAISGLFDTPAYWSVFALVVIASGVLGAKVGVAVLASKAGNLAHLIFGGGTCNKCGTPYGKEAVVCLQCGAKVNE